MKRLRNEINEIDAIDARILSVLSENSRISVADLARTIGLSSPSASERVKRLEEAGVIKRYTIDIDPAALGRPLSVWLRISPIPGKLDTVCKIIQDLPEIVECDRVTGDDCYLARAHVKSVADLENLIDQLVANAVTNTAIIQSPPVERRLPPILKTDG